MEIINKNIEEYFNLANNLKEMFNQKKYTFIKSVYIQGSFARGEVVPKESDLNIMVFTKKDDILKKDVEKLDAIKESINKKSNIKIEFKINSIKKKNLKNITTDLFYPYLYDFILNSFFIYGNRIEEDLLKYLKNKSYFEFNFETTNVFSKIRIDFLENYFENNKYKMYHNLYKYSRLLKQLKVNEDEINKTISKIQDYKNIDKEEILKYILKFEEWLEKTNLKEIYENNKKLKIILAYARGGLVYNKKTKKILLLEDDHSSCSFWSYPKGGVLKKEMNAPLQTVKREIEEETGLKNVKVIKKKIGECHHWFEKSTSTFRKTHTEYYYATTDSEEIKVSKEHINYKWVKISEIPEYISSPCLGYIAKSFYEDFIKKL